MKKTLFFLFACCSVLCIYGQKVDIDKYNFVFNFRDLPSTPLNANYRTYSFKVSAAGTVKDIFTDDFFHNNTVLHGWKKVSSGPSHVVIKINLEDMTFKETSVTERIEVKKDKDGKETGRTYYYQVSAPYEWSGTVKVTTFQDSLIYSESLGVASTWKSREYTSRNDAADYWNNNRYEIKNELLKQAVTKELALVDDMISSKFGFSPRAKPEFLWILDSKKHPEYQAQQEKIEEVKSIMLKVTSNDFSETEKQKLVTVLKYFEQIPDRFSSSEKGDKKLRYASYYNRSKIYLFLDNPTSAKEEARKLIANGYDANDGEKLIEQADELISLFEKNKITSRHFSIDDSSFQPPTVARY